MSGVESVLGLVLVDEEQATEQARLGIERGIGRPVGNDFGDGGLRGGGCCSSWIVFNIILIAMATAVAATTVDGFRLVVIAAGSRVTGMGAVQYPFMGLQQNRQYDVSYREEIGGNLSSADSISTNRRENSQLWLRKRISQTCSRVSYTSGRD